MNKNLKIILLFVVAGVLSALLHFGMTARYADWISTDGVITDIQFHHSSPRRHTNDSYEIHFSYTVEGETYTGVNAYSGKKTDRYVGEHVTVWYDPDHHDDASFHPPGPGVWPFVPFIIGIPLRCGS